MRTLAAIGLAMMVSTGAMAEGLKDYGRPDIWTGFYIGAHAGYGWASHDISVAHPCYCPTLEWGPEGNTTFAGSGAADGKGFIAGAQIGADKQYGNLVLGAVIDASKGKLDGEHVFRMDYDTDWAVQTKIDWFGSARARIGFHNGPILLYATGGVAWARVSTEMQTISITGPLTMSELSSKTWHVGYVYGAGAEWAFARNWSLSVEYLRYNFGSADYGPKGLAYAGTEIEFKHHELAKGDLEIQVIRGGLNLKF